jgi:hypothetical protein
MPAGLKAGPEWQRPLQQTAVAPMAGRETRSLQRPGCHVRPRMDKSRKYIAMCRQAIEIQACWQHEYGDFYQNERGDVKCWLAKPRPAERFKKGIGISVEPEGLIRLKRYVWMPRQDQLIEMAQIPGRRYENILQNFFDWTKIKYADLDLPPGKIFNSMEQIWMAFVMQQKFAKTWDGYRWKHAMLTVV